jgi:hypothetical protein
LLLGSETEEDGMKDEDSMMEKKNEMLGGRSRRRLNTESTEGTKRRGGKRLAGKIGGGAYCVKAKALLSHSKVSGRWRRLRLRLVL